MNDIDRARMKRKLKKNTDNNCIALAPQRKTAAFQKEISIILRAIADITHHEAVRHSLINDLSTVSEFFNFGLPSRSDLNELSRQLNVPVQADDIIWQVAWRISKKQ